MFSATVAALLAVSVPSVVQNPQDASAFYLAHIYQELSTQPNGSQPAIPSNLSNPTDPFIPPTSAVWINGLWFLSLVISLTCALLATLVQQWARRYLKGAHPDYKPRNRARIRAFYKHGVDKLHIPWTMEAVPMLLHLSLFLFFAGLSVFLFGIHHSIFKVVTAWIALCLILYACLTVLPIIHKNSPYSTPLSALASFCLTGMRYVFFQFLQRFFRLLQRLFRLLQRKFPQIGSSISIYMLLSGPRAIYLYDFFSHSMSETAEEFAFRLPPDIDHRSLSWTFESLDEDTNLEKFFEGLPHLCDSETGKELDLQQGFIQPNKQRLSSALIGLMNHTLSSNLVTEFVKRRRMIICTKAVESTSLLGPWWFLRRVLHGDWSKFLECIEFGLFVQTWKNIVDKVPSFYAQCVAALTISIVRDRDRDERWFQLASDLLKVQKPVVHIYIKHGDSMQLAIATFIARRTVQTYSGSVERYREDILDASSKTLETVGKLNIRGTLPDLQHEFCGLWNQLVHTAQTDQRLHHVFVSKKTLKNIRKIYIALHESSDRPPTAFYTTTDDRDPVLDDSMSYPRCTNDDHHPSPVPDLRFDEPADVTDATNLISMPVPTVPYPYSSAWPPLLRPSSPPGTSNYDTPADPVLAAPPLNVTMPFPEPQVPIISYAWRIPGEETSQSLPPPQGPSPPGTSTPTPSPPLQSSPPQSPPPRLSSSSPPPPSSSSTPHLPPPPGSPPAGPASSASSFHLGDVYTQHS